MFMRSVNEGANLPLYIASGNGLPKLRKMKQNTRIPPFLSPLNISSKFQTRPAWTWFRCASNWVWVLHSSSHFLTCTDSSAPWMKGWSASKLDCAFCCSHFLLNDVLPSAFQQTSKKTTSFHWLPSPMILNRYPCYIGSFPEQDYVRLGACSKGSSHLARSGQSMYCLRWSHGLYGAHSTIYGSIFFHFKFPHFVFWWFSVLISWYEDWFVPGPSDDAHRHYVFICICSNSQLGMR